MWGYSVIQSRKREKLNISLRLLIKSIDSQSLWQKQQPLPLWQHDGWHKLWHIIAFPIYRMVMWCISDHCGEIAFVLTTLHGEVRGQDGEAASDTVSCSRTLQPLHAHGHSTEVSHSS